METLKQFQITGMTLSGFKCYPETTELTFGCPTVITGGNGRGKTSIADAIAFAVTGLPFFGERGIDRLHSEQNPDLSVTMRILDEANRFHTLTRTRQKGRMTITYSIPLQPICNAHILPTKCPIISQLYVLEMARSSMIKLR